MCTCDSSLELRVRRSAVGGRPWTYDRSLRPRKYHLYVPPGASNRRLPGKRSPSMFCFRAPHARPERSAQINTQICSKVMYYNHLSIA